MKDFIDAIKNLSNDIDINIVDDDTISLRCKTWKNEIEIDCDSTGYDDTLECIRELISYITIPNLGFAKNDYLEIAVNIIGVYFYDSFEGNSIEINEYQNKIAYEIGSASDEFAKLIETQHSFHNIEPENFFTTIKIFNLNSVLKVNYTDPFFIEQVKDIVKCIFFDLSSKNSIDLCFFNIPESDDGDYDPFYEVNEKFENVENQSLMAKYDRDLINYYNRALQMEGGEFQYLAYYQVMECIFDEVFLSENIQDVKQIITSNWFSSFRDDDITQIIKIIEQYNKNKNDREKLRLVLDKYFKGNLHEEAYLTVNKQVIDLLIEMKAIKAKNDFKDLQVMVNIIYDYRCQCTHSNRTFPFRTVFSNTSDELANYIKLIKMVSERIIINYKPQIINKI